MYFSSAKTFIYTNFYDIDYNETMDEWAKFLGAKFASPDADNNRSLECLTAWTTSSVTTNYTNVSMPYDGIKLQDVTMCRWRHIMGRWRRRRNCSSSAAPCGTPNYPVGDRAWNVGGASQERATGRLQELPSNLHPVSLLQVDVCHRGTASDDYSGGPPTRYTGRVQAGMGLQGQCMRP